MLRVAPDGRKGKCVKPGKTPQRDPRLAPEPRCVFIVLLLVDSH
jgi:hypothetical protein